MNASATPTRPNCLTERSRRRGQPGIRLLLRILGPVLALLVMGAAAPLFAQQDGNPAAGDERMVLIPWARAPKEAPVFYSVRAEVRAAVARDRVKTTQHLRFKVHQGQARVLSVRWIGEGEIIEVRTPGISDPFAGLQDWSLRESVFGSRYLDLHPIKGEKGYPVELEVVVTTETEFKGEQLELLLPGPAEATGFALDLQVTADPAVDLRVLRMAGLSHIDLQQAFGKGVMHFVGHETPGLLLRVTPTGLGTDGVELMSSQLLASLEKDQRSVSCVLEGRVRAGTAGAKLELLSGQVALLGQTSGDGWRIGLRKGEGGQWVHELIATRAGEFPLRLRFGVPVTRQGDWRNVDFTLLCGVVVPVRLEGFDKGVQFSGERPLVPRPRPGGLIGYLPPTGLAAMSWQKHEEVEDGSLFFSSTEVTDVRVGSGLMRQRSVIDLRVLQGKLTQLVFDLSGKGEILSVSGDSTVVGWKVSEKAGKRQLEVSLSRPVTKDKQLTIESQVGMQGKPLEASAIRISPVGALRHSGWLRVANQGSVRVEVMETSGLIQLAPNQFPAGHDASLRQAVVYRFPNAEFDYRVHASQVLPEVSVSEVTVYELGESDRRIHSDIELDIREAPVREWSLRIPADHAVSSVAGAQVADYAVGSEVEEGMRTLTILFKGPVMDRQLVQVVMARNQAPKAGAWTIQPLGFEEVKSRRGYIGAVAAPGYRLEAKGHTGLAEIPVSFFPKRFDGLQQSFRLREMEWSLELNVEELGQSVQADVFHLYSLKAGAVYGSVLFNYFVVGAPATEWRIEVPEGIGNIDVTGQNVGRDWRRNGNTVVVPLSRPVLGAATILLTFEQPMSSRGGQLNPGAVRPLDVQGERGIIQVVSPLQVNHRSTRSGSLLEIDPSEIPTEFRLLSTAPTLKAWQYTARDFEIGMEIEWFSPGDTISQLVDFQKLSTHISRDGQWVTDSQIFVKSRGRSVLRMMLPEGSSLWQAEVNGEPVNARADGKDLLVPLSSEMDPNQSIEISLRYGAESDNPNRPTVAAPQFDVPVVIGEWTVTGDEGRRLTPKGGTANLVAPVEVQTGWEWMSLHPGLVLLLVVMVGGSWLLVRADSGTILSAVGVMLGLLVIGLAVLGSVIALATTDPGSEVLEYAAPVVAADQAVTVEVANQTEWAARTGWGVAVGLLAGLAICLRGLFASQRLWVGGGVAVVLGSVLFIHGGATLFLLLVAASLAAWWLPQAFRELMTWRIALQERRNAARAAAKAAAGAIALLACLVPSTTEASPKKPAPPLVELESPRAAESVDHDWDIREGRLFGTLKITLTGEAGDRYLLLDHPAVLNRFSGEGLKVVSGEGDGMGYWLIATEDGRLSGTAEFEMPVDPAKGWKLPTGPAALQQVKVRWDQGGWEFVSPAAVRVEPVEGVGKEVSAAVLSLSPMEQVMIRAQARQRDVSLEETRFYSEVSNLFLPGPGVVNGRHLVTIRPAQGEVRSLSLSVPEGYTVSDVVAGPVGNWRFDPESRELRLSIQPAQSSKFRFVVETQRSTGDLPVSLQVTPMRVKGAAGEVGLIGMAFGEEVQPEGLKTEGLSKVNPEDFDASLVPVDEQRKPLAVLLHAFRYGSGKASLSLRVNPVAPELRSHIWQLVSLGEDRLLVTADLEVLVTRSGVFRLQIEVPDSLEVESATGEGLSHWAQLEAKDGKRIVTLHLTGKTIGKRNFSLALVGRPVSESQQWSVPKVTLQEASRETGVLTVVPERGLRVRAIQRKNIAQLDPRELAGQGNPVARAAVRPDALSYRLLQSDWELGLSIRRLDPWVTAQVFHDATIREGQVLTKVNLAYRIDNAAVKSRRVRIAGLDEKSAATLRATGSAVADFVPVEGAEEVWEIRFRRGIAGQAEVTLEWQRPTAESGNESVTPIELIDVRQTGMILCLRAGGRLELEPGKLPRGWQATDWTAVQGQLGSQAGGEPPHLTFKVADPEGPLPVILKRHDLANLRKIRVSEGSLTSLTSPSGNVLTAATMRMEVVDKSTLRLKLPEGAELFNVFVNDEGASLVREGDDWLFYVFPSPDTSKPTELRFVYSSKMIGGSRLQGPVLDVPMENLTWRVLVPEGWTMTDFDGDFDLRQQERRGKFRLEDYQSLVMSRSESETQSVVEQLDQANDWLQAGDQKKAGIALRNVINNGRLDAASSEDARVQLRRLKTQQAVLGLNSRRQRLMLDNQAASQQQEINPQVNQAAAVNPVLKGEYNYDPNQFDRFLDGNTADENAALKAIANRIVAQQLAAEPAPASLDVTLPERGTVLSFGRSVQVGSDEAMTLDIELRRSSGGFSPLAGLLCLVIAGLVIFRGKPRK